MKSYTEDDGLVGQVVYDITQGPDGKIWAITDKALNIFDGQKWEVITQIKGELLPNSNYTRLHYDEKNEQILLLGYLRNNTFKLFTFKDNKWLKLENPKMSDYYIISILNNDSEKLYLFTYKGDVIVYNIKDYNIEYLKFENDLHIEHVNFFNNELAVFTDKGIYNIFENERGSYIKMSNYDIAIPHVNMIVNDRVYKNQVIVLCNDEFYRSDNYTFNISHKRIIPIKSKTIEKSLIQVYQTEKDNLYIISNDQFFIANESGQVESIVSSDFDDEQWVNRFFVDTKNIIWLATNKGIRKIDSFMLRHIDLKNGLMMNEVTAINEFNNGTVFLGLNNGYQLFDGINFLKYENFKSTKPTKRVLSTYHNTFSDEIYLASTMSGLFKLSLLRGLETIDTNIDRVNDVIFIGDTLVYSKNNNTIEMNINDINLSENYLDKERYGYIRRIFHYNNHVYIMTNRGISNIKDSQIYSGINKNKETTSSTYSLIPFYEGYLVGTLGGLVYWNGINDDDNKLIEIDGTKLDMSVYTSIYDKYGRLFLGTNKGIYIINSKFDKVRIINKSDGLLSNEINRGALKELQNGDIYIGTDKGLSIYRSKFDEINLSAPEATVSHSIESDFIKGNTIYIFKINIPNYYDISSHSVRYKLTGFDDDFKEIARSQLQDIVYTNLNSGTYQFEVQVKHKNSNWSLPFVSEEIEVSQNVIISYFKWIFIFLLVTIFTSYLFKKYPISKPQV